MIEGQFRCDLSIMECLGHALFWLVVVILTLGLGALVYPYALARFVVNKTVIVCDGVQTGRLVTNLDLGGQLWHLVLWFIFSVLTFGVAYVAYLYQVGKLVADNTVVVSVPEPF